MVNSLRRSTQPLVQLSSCLWHQQRLWLLGLPAPHSLSPAHSSLLSLPAHSSQCPNSVNFPSIQRPTAAVEEWLLGGGRSGSKETLPRPLTYHRPWQAQCLCRLFTLSVSGQACQDASGGGTSWQIYHSRVPAPRFCGAGTQR